MICVAHHIYGGSFRQRYEQVANAKLQHSVEEEVAVTLYNATLPPQKSIAV